MQHKLKYINLFEDLTEVIPNSKYTTDGGIRIYIPEIMEEIPDVYNGILLQSSVVSIFMNGNKYIKEIDSFNRAEFILSSINFTNNYALERIKGFDKLFRTTGIINFESNPKLYSIEGFDKLNNNRGLFFHMNDNLRVIDGFSNLEIIQGRLNIYSNPNLTHIKGFDNLKEIWDDIIILQNDKLIAMSLNHKILNSLNSNKNYIYFENKAIHDANYFYNDEKIIKDCINKFEPGLHDDYIIKEIMKNLTIYGTPETQGVIINHLLSKGNYWSLIPESMKHLVEDTYKHLYHPDFNNTGAKSVAKVATGVTYGLF